MTIRETIVLTGRSGCAYSLTAFPFDQLGAIAPGGPIGAVFAIMGSGLRERRWTRRSVLDMDHKPCPDHIHQTVLYVGQTEDVQARVAAAERDSALIRIGATELAVLECASLSRRQAIEEDLVRRYAPLLDRPLSSPRRVLVETITIAPWSTGQEAVDRGADPWLAAR